MNQLVWHITNTIAYLNQFRGKTFLIKLGGSILDNDTLIESMCADLKLLKQAGINIIIVHGGSKAINSALTMHNIESQFIDGLRVTSLAAMNIIEMVLCGQVNTLLVRKLNHIGIQAVGLAGSDGNMLLCDYYSKQHGYVGTISSVDCSPIMQLISRQSTTSDIIPVIAPVGVDKQGNPMNINADHAAAELAVALQVDKLIYLTDQDGIYDQHGTLLSELCYAELNKLIDNKTVYGGMLTKVRAILSVLENNSNDIHILNGNTNHVLFEELFTVNGVGTLCKQTTNTQQPKEAVV